MGDGPGRVGSVSVKMRPYLSLRRYGPARKRVRAPVSVRRYVVGENESGGQ